MKTNQIELNFDIGNEVYFIDKNIIVRGFVSEIDIKVTTNKEYNFRIDMLNTWTHNYNIVYKITDTKNQNDAYHSFESIYREQNLLFGSKQELIESL